MYPEREKREIIKTLFLSTEGTKTGFFRLLLTHNVLSQVGAQCVCGGLTGTLAC